MSTEKNTEIVCNFIQQFWNEGNFHCLDQFLTEDYVDNAYVPNNMAGLEDTARTLHTGFPDQLSTVESIIAQGDRVIVRLRMKGTHKGSFRGTDATQKPIDVNLYREYRLIGGKIAEHWALFDTASLFRQIGADLHQQPACQINK